MPLAQANESNYILKLLTINNSFPCWDSRQLLRGVTVSPEELKLHSELVENVCKSMIVRATFDKLGKSRLPVFFHQSHKLSVPLISITKYWVSLRDDTTYSSSFSSAEQQCIKASQTIHSSSWFEAPVYLLTDDYNCGFTKYYNLHDLSEVI